MVKCRECGYLAVRNKITGQLVSPLREQRETGFPPDGTLGIGIDGKPLCAVGAFDLVDGLPPGGAAGRAVVMAEERECPQFTELIPVLTPKEHLDMNALQKQDEFHRKCREDDQRWRAEQADKQRAWQERQEEAAERRHKTDLRYRTWHWIITVVAMIAAAWLGATLKQGQRDTVSPQSASAVTSPVPRIVANPTPAVPPPAATVRPVTQPKVAKP